MATPSNTQHGPPTGGEQAYTALPPSAVGTVGPSSVATDATQSLGGETVPLAAGQRLAGRYELIAPIARGGYGTVWRARHVQIGREFAIKVLLESRAASGDPDALIEEARRVAALEHPNIVNMIDVGFAQPGRPFVVMEMLEGRTLRAELQGEPIPWARARPWVLRALAGLAFAHDAGVVHGDITPNNIFLDEKNATTKLIDFGLAHSEAGAPVDAADASDAPRAIRGTPAYMSPEQLEGLHLGPASDLYGFGCVLFEILTGGPPHGGSQNEVIVGHLEQNVSRKAFPREVPAALVRTVLRCLRKSPDRRPRDARELAQALSEAPTTAVPAPRPRHPWLTPIASAAAVVATMAGLLGLFAPTAPVASLEPVAFTIPRLNMATHTPALAAQLPVLEVAIEHPRPLPPTARRPSRRARPAPAPQLQIHPSGQTEAAPPSDQDPPAAASIAHLDGLKNPFRQTVDATSLP